MPTNPEKSLSPHVTSPNAGKKTFPHGAKRRRREKKCLPRAILPSPIIKSQRHDPIRRREADGVKILKTYGIMTPYCPPEGQYGV